MARTRLAKIVLRVAEGVEDANGFCAFCDCRLEAGEEHREDCETTLALEVLDYTLRNIHTWDRAVEDSKR